MRRNLLLAVCFNVCLLSSALIAQSPCPEVRTSLSGHVINGDANGTTAIDTIKLCPVQLFPSFITADFQDLSSSTSARLYQIIQPNNVTYYPWCTGCHAPVNLFTTAVSPLYIKINDVTQPASLIISWIPWSDDDGSGTINGSECVSDTIRYVFIFSDTTRPTIVCPPDLVYDIMDSTTCQPSQFWETPTIGDNCSVQETGFGLNFNVKHWQWSHTGVNPILIGNTDSIVISGSNTADAGIDTASLCYLFNCPAIFRINWNARLSANDPSFINDHVYYSINGVWTKLTPDVGQSASGILELTMAAYDNLCFHVISDNTGAFSILNLSLVYYNNLFAVQTWGPRPDSEMGAGDGDPIPGGMHTVYYQVTDCGGNMATCSFTITANDTPPTITCPEDITVYLDTMDCMRSICYNIESMDNCTNSALVIPGYTYVGTLNGNTYYISDTGALNRKTWQEANLAAAQIGGHLVAITSTPENNLLRTYIPLADPLDRNLWIGLQYIPRLSNFLWNTCEPLDYENFAGVQPPNTNSAYAYVWESLNGTWFDSPESVTNRYIVEFEGGLPIIQTSGVPSGQSFPLGTTTNSFEAIDAIGQTDACSFTVTILGSKSLQCKPINLSLDETCQATITPAMALASTYACYDAFVVELTVYGVEIPNPITPDLVGKKVIATVTDTTTGNSCWSQVLIEDKLGPKVICYNDTVSCVELFMLGARLDVIEECSTWDTILLDETSMELPCDTHFIRKLTQTWTAVDEWGNQGNACNREIFVTRVFLDSLVMPEGVLTLECSDIEFFDDNGNPHPTYTGIPTLYGVPVWPPVDFSCNYFVEYEDFDLGNAGCTKLISRTWTAREWWCSQEMTRTTRQIIQIVDTKGPEIISAPIFDAEYTVKNKSCLAPVYVGPIEAIDACHDIFAINIIYPGGILKNTNGATLQLTVGTHVITYQVIDNCYNVSEWSARVNVSDGQQPIVICQNRTTVSLTVVGTALAPASAFDDGSFDECSGVTLQVRRMDENSCGSIGPDDWGPDVLFCCEDVGKFIMVGLLVTDSSGNSNMCMISTEVQDKYLPVLHCPPHITVDCRIDWDPEHLDLFGKIGRGVNDRDSIKLDPYHPIFSGPAIDGYVDDNCILTIVDSSDRTLLTSCGTGFMVRIIGVEDAQGNRPASCVQFITFVNNSMLTEDSIIWPLDLELNGCPKDPSIFNPNTFGIDYARPRVIDDECRMIAIEYDDKVLSTAQNSCIVIERTWSVVDWCNNTNGTFEIWTNTQLITVFNTDDPILVCSRDTLICMYTPECQPLEITLSASATDLCTPTEELWWKYLIDLDNNGSYNTTNQGINLNSVTGTFPVGEHRIRWEVEDRCGNTAICESLFEIRNCKAPTAYCIHGLSVALVPTDTDGNGTPDAEIDTVWAADLDAGSNHVCNYYVVVSFSADTTDVFRIFDCDDLGQQFVELWVTDINGNQSVCRTFIVVEDNNMVNICPPKPIGGTISGIVGTAGNGMVEQVKIQIAQQQLEKMTDNNGAYAFTAVPLGKAYTIQPLKNDDWLNGVTTGDIVRIQKHILGTQPLTNPYEFIAADVNKNNVISAKDISDLRKLILGFTTGISGNTSWRFVDKLYQWHTPSDPLAEAFPESYEIKDFTSDMDINFVGVKIGDLNGNAKTRNAQNNGSSRTSFYLDLTYQNTGDYLKDNVYPVVIRAANISECEGFQGTIVWDNTNFDVLTIHPNEAAGFSVANYSDRFMSNGKLPVSWNGALENSEELFTLIIRPKKDLNALHLQINSSIIQALSVRTNDNNDQAVHLREIGKAENSFEAFQSEPNPWLETVSIKFNLPDAGMIKLSIYDVTGKLVYLDQLHLEKGLQQINLDANQIPHQGVYYYQVDFGQFSQTKKMVKLN